MEISLVDQIPKDAINTPTNNLSELYSIAQKMERLCIEHGGIGLSAVQVGIPWKFFIYYDTDKQKFMYMVDCDYEPLNDKKFLSIEGCLSLKNLNNEIRRFKLMRYESIRVCGKCLVVDDKIKIEDFDSIYEKGISATVIQHEIDHHKGVLISDIGEEIYLKDIV